MYVKIHTSTTGRTIIAVCDDAILGKSFTGNGMQIMVSEHFYKGDYTTKEETATILKRDADFNLVGTETITLGLALGIITNEHLLTIGDVPHAIVVAL